ncbi:MAG: maleylpyruvate isomerase family mycothiol-dependent enzyme [Planctomycetaceae bacterium]
MDYGTFVAHVRLDGDRLATVADGKLDAPVPSCPGWTVRDLATHVAQVYEHKIACTDLGVAPDPWPPAWPADRDPIVWFGDAHRRLLAMFDTHDATDPSATWWPTDQTVGFWARRMAHETAIHRVDAELAAEAETPVDPALALDGIDEVLTIMLAGDWSEAPIEAPAGQRVAVEAGGRRWVVTFEPTAILVVEEQGSADAAVRGDPSDLVCWLWGRAADDRVAPSGPQETIRLLRSRLELATQ